MPFPPAKSESSVCPQQDVILKVLQLPLGLLLDTVFSPDDTYPSDLPAHMHKCTSQTILIQIIGPNFG